MDLDEANTLLSMSRAAMRRVILYLCHDISACIGHCGWSRSFQRRISKSGVSRSRETDREKRARKAFEKKTFKDETMKKVGET